VLIRVCFTPESDQQSALGCLLSRIGPLLHAEWDVKTKRPCGFEVDDQIEPSWRLHGEVFRLSAFENTVDIYRRLGKLFGEVVSVSNQTASLSQPLSSSSRWLCMSHLLQRNPLCSALASLV
jgi:hypothetical protein